LLAADARAKNKADRQWLKNQCCVFALMAHQDFNAAIQTHEHLHANPMAVTTTNGTCWHVGDDE
jgi:hypothetical protein